MGETILYAIKIGLIVAAVVLFVAATTQMFNFVVAFASASIIGEVFGIISMCLPFNALAVFTSLFAAFDVVLAWVLARKLFSINRKAQESA